MRELLEQGWGLAGIAAVSGVGVLARLLLLGYYGMLCRACGRFEITKNKTVAYIRDDLEKRAGRQQEIKNALTYTEYRLAERRVCGFRIGSLETAMPYSVLLTGVSSVLLSMAGLLTESEHQTVLRLLLSGGMSVAGLMVLDVVSGLRERNKRVRLRLRDYIENSWAVSGAGASDEEEVASSFLQKRVSRAERKEGRKAERQKKKERKAEQKERKKETRKTKKKLSVDKPKKAGKKNGKAQEEKRRLTEELLRERRQLEARSLAEQRRKEREEEQEEQIPAEMKEMDEPAEQATAETKEPEGPAEQVQAEAEAAAAATECEFIRGAESSYEALLNEFLKEYPA